MLLLFDIGGTKMRLATSDGKSIGKPKIVSTPQNFDEGMSVFKKSFEEIIKGQKVETCCGGIRRLDAARERLTSDFRLPDWSGKPLKERLTEITGTEVYLENDTALVGLGEATQGSGKGKRIVAYLTISTGVGGVRIVDGKIDANSFGFEPGHQIIDFDWSMYPEAVELEKAGFGQLEAYISGASLEKRVGKSPKDIEDKSIWEEVETVLSCALKNTIVYWSPDVIVLGGGLLGASGISVDGVKDKLSKILKIFPEMPEIKEAELGDVGGLWGSLTYIQDRY